MSEKNVIKMPENGTQGPVVSVLEKGTIGDTRRGPVCDPSQIWRSPKDYRGLDEDQIRGLSKVSGMQQAEFQLAVDELIEQGPTMKARFGLLAPDVSAMPALWKRYENSRDGLAIAQALVVYLNDVNKVAVHDIMQLVGRVDKAVRGVAEENAEVAADFSAVLKISDQRSDIIKQGRARGKEEKAGGGGEVVSVVAATGTDGK